VEVLTVLFEFGQFLMEILCKSSLYECFIIF
jgi:hypothetical protein